jgi:ankyrin repeat protein
MVIAEQLPQGILTNHKMSQKIISSTAQADEQSQCGAPRKQHVGNPIPDDVEKCLLRFCTRLDWESVERCCSSIEMNSARTSLKQAATKMLLARDSFGNTPLHVACYHRPPRRVISALLNAASRCGLEIHTMANARKENPLLIACVTGISNPVIQELLETRQGMTDGGATVSIADDDANTPFTALVTRYEMLRRIISCQAKTLPLENVDCISVIDLMSNNNHMEKKTIWNMFDAVGGVNYKYSYCPLFETFWRSIDSLIQAAWWSQDGSASRSSDLREPSFVSILHGAAYLSASLPTILIDFLFRVYPEMVFATDQKGTHALHLAITTDTVRLQSQLHPRLVYQRKHFIDRLLKLDPSAARRPVPSTGTGGQHLRSPFCQAIASGLHWHIASCCDTKSSNNQRAKDNNTAAAATATATAGPLQSIWRCAPEKLYTRDIATGLYPFMLAAATRVDDHVCQSLLLENCAGESAIVTIDTYQLDTVYNLLRLYPQVLKQEYIVTRI